MNHEFERTFTATHTDVDARVPAVQPCQLSRSALLRKPEHPIASGLVQYKVGDGAGREAGRDSVHEQARDGIAGAALSLPFLDQIQRSFGRHDVSGIRAHVDESSARACEAMGAAAYAMGNDVAFRRAPDLHTAAHEAAHVVQQRAGVRLAGGVGAPGDEYERNADQVADAVLAGRSAEPLLAGAGTGRGTEPSSAVGTGVQTQPAENVATPVVQHKTAADRKHKRACPKCRRADCECDKASGAPDGQGEGAVQMSGGAGQRPAGSRAPTRPASQRPAGGSGATNASRGNRGAAPARAAIVEDGQAVGPGQMHRSELLAALGAAITQGCDQELAPFGRTARDCPIIARSLARYAAWPAASLVRALERFGRAAPGADARGLIAGAVARAREMARKLAITDQHDGGAPLQAMAVDRSAGLAPHDPASVRAGLGSGQPLDAKVREHMEGALGTSFAEVRVHTDAGAARISRELGARAFTVGQDVAFAAGEYQPGTSSGDRLIAHELTHTLQQREARAPSSASGAGNRELEHAADRAAAAAIERPRGDVRARGDAAPVQAAGAGELRIQRWPAIVAGAIATAEVGADVAVVDGVVTVVGVEAGATTVAAAGTEIVVAGGTEVAVASAPAAVSAAAPAAATASVSTSSVLTATGVGVAATTLSSDSPSSDQDTRRDECRETWPSALECTNEGADIYEVAAMFLVEQGRDVADLGTCSGRSSFGPGVISACNDAPGESWHCSLRGTDDEISVFGCLCCSADGASSYEFTGAHWSENLSRRGRR